MYPESYDCGLPKTGRTSRSRDIGLYNDRIMIAPACQISKRLKRFKPKFCS